MINYYERAKSQPEIFNPLVCKDLLFVHYDCPLESNDRINGYSTITFDTFSLKKGLSHSGSVFRAYKRACCTRKKGAVLLKGF